MKKMVRSLYTAASKGDATFLSRVTKGLTTAALALAAMFVTGSALAATPTAVWDGDFSTATKSGWTLSLKSGGALPTAVTPLAISGDVLKLDSANTKYANGAIVVRYSGYTASSLENTAIASADVNGGSEDAGCEANNGILKTYWGTTVNRSLTNTLGSYSKDNVSIPASGYMILAYNTGTGTAAYFTDKDKGEWKGGYDNGIKWSGKTVVGFAVGGPRQASPHNTMGPCSTMTIEAVAVFENYNGLDQSGIEGLMAYEFPDPNTLTYNTFLTSDWTDTGWPVEEYSKLATAEFFGVLSGGWIDPRPADGTGYFVQTGTNGDGSWTAFELQINQGGYIKEGLIVFQVRDNKLMVKCAGVYNKQNGTLGVQYARFTGSAGATCNSAGTGTLVTDASGQGYSIASIAAKIGGTRNRVEITAAGTNDGNCNFPNSIGGIAIPELDNLPAGTLVQISSLVIAESKDGNTAVQKIKLTIDGKEYISDAMDNSKGTWTWTGEARKFHFYNFSNGPVLTVGTTYDSAITWLDSNNASISSIRFCATQKSSTSTRFLTAITNDGTYTPASILRGEVVPPPSKATATISKDVDWSDIEWDDDEPTEDSAIEITVQNNAVITLNHTLTYPSLKISGACTLKYATPSAEVLATLLPGRAEKVVAPIAETITGDMPTFTCSDQVGCQVTADASGLTYTPLVDVKARTININFAGGRSNVQLDNGSKLNNGEYATQLHGGFPMLGSKWNDLAAGSNTSGETLTAYDCNGNAMTLATAPQITVSKVANPYTTGDNHSVSDRLLFGYCDDGNDGPKAEISNIPFSKYRIYAYFSTDTTDKKLGYLKVTAGGQDTNYCGTTNNGTAGTTKQGTDAWGKSSNGTNAIDLGESINYLVTDVMTASSITLEAKKATDSRAGVAGYQIVDCSTEGHYLDVPTILVATVKSSEGMIFWDAIDFGDVELDKDTEVEITVDDDANQDVYILQGENPIVAKSIKFVRGAGSHGVGFMLNSQSTYDGGKITSEVPLALTTPVSIDVDAGANDLSYGYTGSGTISPTIETTGLITIDGMNAGVIAPASMPYNNFTIAGGGKLKVDVSSAMTINGIKGTGTFIKTGTAELTLNNKSANDYAIDGTTVKVEAGTIKLNNGMSSSDPKVKDATFILVSNANNNRPVYQNGWCNLFGTITFENEENREFLNSTIRTMDGLNFVKRGAGMLTLIANRSGNGSTLDGVQGVTVEEGKFHFNNNVMSPSTLALDFSALDKSATPIDGNFTLATNTSYKFPSTLGENEEFQLCTGTLSGAAEHMQEITVGDKAANARLTFNGNKVKYVWIVETTATISEDTNWSRIPWSKDITYHNAGDLTLTVENNVTITLDGIFNPFRLNIIGNVTFVAADSVYEDGCWEKKLLDAMNFSATGTISFGALKEGFYGAFTQTENGISLRAQNKEVISINIAGGKAGGSGSDSEAANLVTGNGFYGIAPTLGDSWNNINRRWQDGGDQTITIEGPKAYDGNEVIDRPTMSLSATGKNTWNCDSITNPFLRGYLDDGSGVTVVVHGVPYTEYDVIVYATSDDAANALRPITFNGTAYTFKDGETKEGSDVWGVGLCATPEIGKNALRINGCKGDTITINATRPGGTGARATLCAVQVINKGDVVIKQDFSAMINASTKFSGITWTEGEFVEGQLNEVVITVAEGEDEVEIEFDKPDMVLAKLTIASESDRPIKFKATAALPNIPQLIINCAGYITYAWPVTELKTAAGGVAYAANNGSANAAIPLNFAVNDGSMTLKDATFYVGTTYSGTQSTVNMENATVYANGDMGFGIGQASFNLSGTTKLTSEKVILSQGGDNRIANLTLNDSAEIVVTGSSIIDSNQSSIMFGHWNGPSTFTMSDNAKFTAENAQVLVGKTANNQTININGGVFTAKGIKASAGASGTNALNLNGGELKLGEYGITSYGTTTIPVTVAGNAQITSTAAMPITQAITVNEEKTLTFDATAGDITISTAVVNNGTIKVVGGNVIFLPGTFNGTITTEGTGKAIYGYTVTINDCGEFTVPAGIDPASVRLYRADGTVIENTTIKDGKILYTPEFYGKNALMEYLFKGTLVSTGSDTGSLSFDGKHCFPNAEYVLNEEGEKAGGIYAASAPWRNLTFPNEVTVVMYGKMMKTDNTCQIGIGSTTGGSKYTLFLASGDVAKEEVVLGYAYKNTSSGDGAEKHDVLCRMTVPHAQTTEHLYAFTLKKVGDDTVVNIYLDGELLQPYVFKNQTVTLGNGIQLGSIHGGIGDTQDWPAGFGFKRSTDVETDATLDFVRVYNVELNNKVLRAMAADYPYESPSGSFNRTLEGNESWIETDAWSKVGDAEQKYSEPDAGSSVTITPPEDADVTLTSNLAEVKKFEAMTFNAGGKITIAKGEDATGEILVAGRTTISTDTQISFGAMEIGGAVSVAANKTLTFDFSSLDLTKEFASRSIRLTGTALLGDGAKIEATGIPTDDHRTAEIVYDEAAQQYLLAITVDQTIPFVYENEVWTWGTQEVTEEIMNANPTFVRSIKSDLTTAIGTYKFSVEDGATLTASSIANSGLVTVNEGGTFDVNGIDNVAVPTILNGGTLANSGSATAYDHIGTFDVTFTKDSFVNVTTKLHSLGSLWNAFNYNLNGHKLTKTGAGEYMIATGTFVGGGTIDVQEGTFTMDAGTIPANTLLTINVATDANLKFSNGKSKGFTKNGRLNLKLGEGASFTNDQGIGFDELAGTGTFVATGVTAFSDMIDFKGTVKFDLSELAPLSEITLITAPTDTDFLLDGITFALAEDCKDAWTLKVSADKVVAASTIKLIEVDGKAYPTMEEAFDIVSNGSVLRILDTTRLVYDTNTQEFTLDGNLVTVPEGFMFMPGDGGTIVAFLPPGTIPLRISEICPKPDDLDPNGVESSWVELVNDNSFGYIDLGEYELQRFNRGKAAKAGKFANLVSRRLGAGERIVVYMTEGYTDGDDLAFAKGLVAEDEVKEVNGIMIVPAKINPKKYPLVRLLKGKTVVDSVIVPSDLPDGKSVIVGHSTDGATQRWVADPTKGEANPDTEGLTAIGPNVGPLYGVKHELSDNDPVAYAESGVDYPVTLDVNPVDAANDSDAITSVTLIYRTNINDDDPSTFGKVTMVKGEEPDAAHGDRWTASIPAGALPEAGMLVQWKAEITDAASNTWTSPSFMNKDDGYEWYGTIVRPAEGQLSGSLDTMHLFATTVAKGGYIVADEPGNGSNERIMNIDYDALMTETGHADQKAAYPYGARVNIFDSSTMRYYDYVRIDLRGNTSAGFKKKSHGLRFAKANPLKIAAKAGFNGITVDEIRKTSFISEMCDPSRLRQMTSFWLFNNEQAPAPFDYPVRLNLNGEFYQIGFHSERFSDDLIEKSYGLNKFVYSYKNIGTFQPGSGTSAGGIEKKTPDDGNETGTEALKELEAFRQSISAAGNVAASKDGSIDTGLENAALTKTVVESFDLPSWLNYLAIARITHENDDVWANISGYWDSPWTIDGVRGTGTWHPLVYDTNLSFGQWYFQDDSERGHVGLLANADDFKSHPFYGGCRVRAYKSNGTAAGNSNYAVESIYQHEKFRRLYLRRLRTLMDKYLADSSETTNPIAVKMREFLTYMGCNFTTEQDGADCVKELEVWGHVTDSGSGCGAVNVWTAESEPKTLVAGYKEIWEDYILPRREHLFVKHAAANHEPEEIGYANNLCAGIPAQQSELAKLIETEGSPNFTVRYDATIKAVVIKNKNAETVDMSGWTLEGPIAWTIPAGTVIDQAIDGVPGEVYVTADRRFTIGAMGEITDQVVVGNGEVGTGALVLKSGDTIVAQEAEPTVDFGDDTDTPVATGVSVPAEWLRENVLELRKVDVTDPAEEPTVNAAIKKLGRNGFRIWESWTLGLEPKVETSKPYLVGVQNDEAEKVTFEFGGIEVQTGDNVPTVNYAVEYADSLDFSSPSKVEKTDENPISVDLPTESDKKVRYYRPKFTFE